LFSAVVAVEGLSAGTGKRGALTEGIARVAQADAMTKRVCARDVIVVSSSKINAFLRSVCLSKTD